VPAMLDLGADLSRDTGVRHNFQHLMEIDPLMERACLAFKFLEDYFQYFLPIRISLHLGGYGLQSITHG
jgi:hypothetical protein